jgi:hypothetical protein
MLIFITFQYIDILKCCRTTSDLISAIDQPGGTVQDVRCDTEMAFPDCHFLGHLLCPLLRGGCGHHTLDQPSPIVC